MEPAGNITNYDRASSLSLVTKPPSRFSISSALSFSFLIFYCYLFYADVAPYWFNPKWTTDDALQQIYPFHAAYHPQIFKNDLITEVMLGYLPPIHYWISYGTTLLTHDPIMMGHWVMLLQVALSSIFLFLAVHTWAGFAPACFAVAWLLHTRHIMQRLTAGLPRGWAAVVFTAYLFCLAKNNHRAVLFTILVGCLLHPPATFLIALSYGLFLCWKLLRVETRSLHLKPFIQLLLAAPIFLVVTLYVLHRPEYIGTMVSYEQASKMVEFQNPDGRFPFVPLLEPWHEIRMYGFQAFISRFYNPGKILKGYAPQILIGLLSMLLIFQRIKKRELIDAKLITFLIGALTVYFLSRLLAFKLYVPNRHLQFPLAIFFITTFTVATWRLFAGRHNRAWRGIVGLTLLGAFIFTLSGNGLQGTANFNWETDKRGGVYEWIKNNTPQNALIAGDPTHIDGVQLIGMRRAYATTETAHPFYDIYYKEMRRRLEISLRAHFARDLNELLTLLEPEKIDYFVFKRAQFYPEALQSAYYYEPFKELVKLLGSRQTSEYAYRQLPKDVNLVQSPYMPFKDRYSAIVDLKKLKAFLDKKTK